MNNFLNHHWFKLSIVALLFIMATTLHNHYKQSSNVVQPTPDATDSSSSPMSELSNLQEKCVASSQAFYQHLFAANASLPSSVIGASMRGSYSNHYSEADSKCYVYTSIAQPINQKPDGTIEEVELDGLSDVIQNIPAATCLFDITISPQNEYRRTLHPGSDACGIWNGTTKHPATQQEAQDFIQAKFESDSVSF